MTLKFLASHVVLLSISKDTFAYSLQKLYERCQPCVVKDDYYFEGHKVNLFVSSVLFVFWYHSPNVLDTPHIWNISRLRVKRQYILSYNCYFCVQSKGTQVGIECK
jgi:hypothetical protein